MMVVVTEFVANLNADKIYMDLTYLADPILKKFWLTIQNQGLSTLYFKIINNIPNWTLDTPADGKLGSVATGVTTTFTSIITRANPGAETTDSGSLKIEAYTDSGYTNKIGDATLDVTVYIEDLENWTDVAKSDFDDGTAQGWTLDNLTISSDLSVEVSGYSASGSISRTNTKGITSKTCSASKSLTLPDRNKVRVAFFMAFREVGNHSYAREQVLNLDVRVDGKNLDIPFLIKEVSGSKTESLGWIKLTADLTSYKGQMLPLKITFVLVAQLVESASGASATSYGWIDRIVVAGKD